MAKSPQVIIVGAGILGLASAYHLLRDHPDLDLLVVERLPGPGRGNTARSAAAYRDMFSSPVNRRLSQGSIAFYQELQNQSFPLDLKDIGYLWLLRSAQMDRARPVLTDMAQAGVRFKSIQRQELTGRIPGFIAGDINEGVLGKNCGILNPHRLAGYYEKESRRLGAGFIYDQEVTGFTRNHQDRINGIITPGNQITAATIIVATGAWMSSTLALADLKVPVTPKKRQLFSLSATEQPLSRLLHSAGFNDHNVLPLVILPDGAYIRPATASFLLGYANPDQIEGLEDQPQADPEFFENRILPQIVPYFPAFQGLRPEQAWAGHYADHLADLTPFVDRLAGAIVVGGTSGSGIMKADSLGRVVAGLYSGHDVVKLADGQTFQVRTLGLKNRAAPPEKFVI